MSTSLSAHNGCLGIFGRSEPYVWGPKIERKVNCSSHYRFRDPNILSEPKVNKHRKPSLRVERNNDDFIYLAKLYTVTPKSTPAATHETASFVEQIKSIPKKTIEESDWVVLQNMMEDEWNFVHVGKDSRPSYADIVTRNGFRVQEPKKHMHMQQQSCSKMKRSKVEKKNHAEMDSDIASSEDMWLCSKYSSEKDYHRKIEIKRKNESSRRKGLW